MNPIAQRRCRDFQCAEENRADFLRNFTDPTCSRPATVIRRNEITAVFALKTHVSSFFFSFFGNPATSATHRCCWFHRVWAEGRLSNLMSSKKWKFNNDMLVLSHDTREGPTITLAINKSPWAESTMESEDWTTQSDSGSLETQIEQATKATFPLKLRGWMFCCCLLFWNGGC